MPFDYTDKRYYRVPLTDITQPKPGRICVGPRYWVVTPEQEVLFYGQRYLAPQCHPSESVMKQVAPKGCTVVYIPMVFLPHNCTDYAD